MKTIERELWKKYKSGKLKRVCKYTHNTLTGITYYEGKASVSRTEQKQVYESLLQDIDDYNNPELQALYREQQEYINNKRRQYNDNRISE